MFKKLEFLKFWLRFLAGKRWRHLAHFKARIQFPNQVPSILKKVHFPQPDLNLGPSYYKAAVLPTELHCQTGNCGTTGGLYTQYAILAFISSKYKKCFWAPGTLGLLYKSYKNIYKLEICSGALTTSTWGLYMACRILEK